MSSYTLTIKKKDIFVEITTQDKVFIAKELDKWVNSISPREMKPVNPVNLMQETYEDAKKTMNEFIDSTPKTPKTVVKEEQVSEFTNVLNKKMEGPVSTEVIDKNEAESKKTISSIKQVIAAKNPETILDFLMVGAYYLTKDEGLDRFSIKQINAKIFAFSQKPIDHSLIQKAVTKGYLKVVPDYTGMADVTEYEITLDGEQYFLNEI